MTFRPLVIPALTAALLLAAPCAVLLAPAAAHAQAARNAAAETFIGREAQRALRILNDKSLPMETKKAQFRQFVDQDADVARITGFVLGKYRRTVTPAQYRAFSAAFREYANNVYETRLSQYRGEGFKVTGSTARSPTDVVVTSEVVGGPQNRHAEVVWRVLLGADGRWRVVDVQVSGVWLAITQQQDFVSTLDNNRGDIDVLTAQLSGRNPAPPSAR